MSKKVPTRTCIACGKASEKSSLVRVVRSPEGTVSLDPQGKAAGRGAYVCPDGTCFAKAAKKGAFAGKLRTRLSAEDYDSLQKDFDALCAARAELR